LIEFNSKHLTYFFTHPKKEYELKDDLKDSNSVKSVKLKKSKSNTNFKVYKGLKKQIVQAYSGYNVNFDNNGESIFTFHANQNLIRLYLKQFQAVYPLPFDSIIKLRDFLEMFLYQRLKKEKFRILNWNKNQLILFSYLTELNINDNSYCSSLNIKNNYLLSKIIVFYVIDIINDKLIHTKLMLEPNENLYITSTEDKNNNKNEFKSYFNSIIKHFRETETKIREALKIPEIPETNESLEL
jgi:hypothetical protein